jgi:hypothetical protein
MLGLRTVLLGGMVAGALSCATGTVTNESGFEPIDGPGVGAGASGSTSHASSSEASSTASGGPQGSGGAAATASSSADSSSSTGGMMQVCSYGSPNQCASATQLSSISGDKNSSQSATGQTSQWFKIHVKEDVGSIFPEDLNYLVTLTSPANMDYDLYVHHGPKGGSADCNAAATKGTGNATTDEVYKKWKDEQGLGGKDDSVWLCIEVRYVSGTECGPAAEWTLTVKGHT